MTKNDEKDTKGGLMGKIRKAVVGNDCDCNCGCCGIRIVSEKTDEEKEKST